MAKDFSFDVVSKVGMQTVSESVQTALKEITNRYDFRGTDSKLELDQKKSVITMESTDDYKLKALYDVLCFRMAKRGLPLKNFTPGKVENALGGRARQVVTVVQGVPKDKAKEITAAIKKSGLKVQASVQGDQLRVSSSSKDKLQDAISFLKGKDFGISLQFENYR